MKLFKRNDIWLVIAILLLAGVFALVFRLTSTSGNSVEVTVDGKELLNYALETDIEKLIETPNGENLLVIKDGKAYIERADCPDGICVKHRKISNTGETIVCLPHKLVVEIVKE